MLIAKSYFETFDYNLDDILHFFLLLICVYMEDSRMFQSIPEIHPNKVHEKNDYTLVDVRRPDEFSGELGHIPGAILKTLGSDLTSWLEQQSKDQKIIFICRSGQRSESATSEALKHQIKQVYNMTGGMILWNELGLKVER